MHAWAQELEEWGHIQFFNRQAQTPTCLIVPPGRSVDRALELLPYMKGIGRYTIVSRVQRTTIVCPPKSIWCLPVPRAVDEVFSPLVYCLAGELLAYYWLKLETRRSFARSTGIQQWAIVYATARHSVVSTTYVRCPPLTRDNTVLARNHNKRGITTEEAYTLSIDHTWVFTPTTILNFRGGVVRSTVFSGNEVDIDTSGWNLAPEVINLLGTTQNRAPNIAMGGPLFALGGGSVNDARDTTYTGSVALQKLFGKHTLKFGYEHRRYYSNVTTGGSFSLATERRVTCQFYDNPVTGHPMASFLLGTATWGQGTQIAGPASAQVYQGAYMQDDWKVTPKLTLNLGLAGIMSRLVRSDLTGRSSGIRPTSGTFSPIRDGIGNRRSGKQASVFLPRSGSRKVSTGVPL